MIKNRFNLFISKQGGLGDGIGYHGGKAIFVPYTIVGDEVVVAVEDSHKDYSKAKLIEIINSSPKRQEAPCPYFTSCGGCKMQHFSHDFYQEFKHNILRDILDKLQVKDVVSDIKIVGEKSRRRVEFAVNYINNEVKIGFCETSSHNIVDIKSCMVLVPEINDLLPDLKLLITSLNNPANCIALNLSYLSNKVDIVIKFKYAIGDDDRILLSEFAKKNNIVRLVVQYDDAELREELIYGKSEIKVDFSGVDLWLPHDVFLQASTKGEEEIIAFIRRSLNSSSYVADLYSGCGTYSFAVADKVKKISAFEGSRRMVKVMQQAIENNKRGDVIEAFHHDLYKKPIKHNQIGKFDTIIINPPRNGALPQIKEIVKSGKPYKIIMVSCNPATFKRDLQYLIDHGYRVKESIAIDQFYWSKHLEVVALLEI